MFKNLFLPLIAVAAFIIVVGLFTQGKLGGNLKNTDISPKNTNSVNLTKPIMVGQKQINVEVARSQAERSRGLGGRTSLETNSGMLFVFDTQSKPNFWMKDTLIPLDIIWIKSNKVIGITKNVQPQLGASDAQLTLYPAPDLVDFVLEVNGGFSDTNNLKIGDLVDTSQI